MAHLGAAMTRGLQGCISPFNTLNWVYYTKIPIYPIFYLLKGDYNPKL